MNFLTKIKIYILAHKIMSVIVLLIIIFVGYTAYAKVTSTTGETRYVLSPATKNTIVSSVEGSGQVSALNQVVINPTVSGILTYVGAKPGDKVASGQTLFSIDSINAQKAVRDAQVGLDSAELALQKIKQPSDNLSLTQAQNTLAKANETKQNAQDSLKKAYDDGFTEVVNSYLDLPSIMTGLNNMFYTSNPANNGQWNIDWYPAQVNGDDRDKVLVYKDTLNASYKTALASYNTNLDAYNITTRDSDVAVIESIIKSTYETTKSISGAIKDASNLVSFVNDSMVKNNFAVPALISTHIANLNTYTSKVNTHLANLSSLLSTIENSKQATTNADLTIDENTQSLTQLQAGANPLDIQSAELSVKQKQNALQDAKDNLANYSVRAPFTGVIASVPVIKGDNASSGTTLGTIITSTELATVTLNEVDVAKIALGEKTTLTFSAIPDLTITGVVAQIDSLGTVSQGVVNYGVKISFDTTDDRVKPGMSADAKIITKVEQNVLTVPNSAVKTQAGGNGTSYVQMFDTALPAALPGVQGSVSATPPRNQTVEIGISDATSTEILSGLNEGDEVVTRIITSTTKTTTTAPSILGSPSGGARGAGGIRIGG